MKKTIEPMTITLDLPEALESQPSFT